MKLRKYTEKGKTHYTLKPEVKNKKTIPAHYKFINSKVRDAPKNN